MKIFLWEMSASFASIVLWDGENTYWFEPLTPSGGYSNLMERNGKYNKFLDSRWTLIGEL